jgi:hypothetical protein
MHGGGGPAVFVRQYLVYAKPWQRAAVVVVLIVGGAVLIGAGNLIGILPVALGIVIAVRM